MWGPNWLKPHMCFRKSRRDRKKEERDRDDDKKVELTATSDMKADTVGSFHMKKLRKYSSNTQYSKKHLN